MNTPTLILLLTDHHLGIHQVSRNTCDVIAELALDEAGLAELRNVARHWHMARFHILVDLAEEDFQFETVPHLGGADQRALFARKLDQHYRSTPYRRIVLRGRHGKQDRLLLSALTRHEQLDQVMATLSAEQCAVAGIHSVALGSVELLRLDRSHLLLVSHTQTMCWRQSYFTPEGLRFSRLGQPPSENAGSSHATGIAEYTLRISQYLNTLRTLRRDDALAVVLLTDADDPPQLGDTFSQTLQAQAPQIHVHVEPVATLAVMLGFPDNCNSWKTLLMLAIARGQIRDHYLPQAAGRFHRLRRLGRGINWSAGLIFLAGLLLAWQGYAENLRLQASIEQTRYALRSAEADKQEGEARLLANGSSPVAMKEAVDLYRGYLADWPDVESTAQALSRILADFPLLSIEHFTWQARSGADIPTPMAGNIAIPETIERRGQIVELSGHIEAFDGNYRAALEQIAQLQARLDRLPHTTTTLLNAPLDIRPQGSIASQESNMATARFALRIIITPVAGGAR
ncbi:MAG: hypothetical protein H6R07_155 [Proteobacteria bacterium]|nr:hypothetical protein [Pseudomonadota bacterium]